MTKEGDARIWWIPQIGMEGVFYHSVPSVEEGYRVCDILGRYDLFQFENRVKPDYANVGGVEIHEDGEWCEMDKEEWEWRKQEGKG